MAIEDDAARQRSRRAILAGAIGGLAGNLLGSRIAWPEEADAAAGGNMRLGRANSAGTKNTSLTTKTTGHALKVTQKGTGTALRGTNTLGTGVSGATANNAKFGVDAANTAVTSGAGAAMRATGGATTGLVATSSSVAVNATGGSYGIQGQGAFYGGILIGTGTSGIGVYGSGSIYGLWGSGGQIGMVAGGSVVGAYGSGATGVQGVGEDIGVVGTADPGGAGDGVRGAGGAYGVHGLTGSVAGVRGDSGYVGVWGEAPTFGVVGLAGSGVTYGVYGLAATPAGYGVFSSGNMHVAGTLTKTAGSFLIDHPLDPENRWLAHSFVESPDMMNVYNGTAKLDDAGKATVKLPAYFEALNRDFRYQLTAVGGPAPDLHVSREIDKNAFSIAGGTAGQKVSWQVTGIRQDDYAKAHPIKVETDKGDSERGMRQFVPKGSKARLMTVGPAAPREKQPATPTAIPDKVSPINH